MELCFPVNRNASRTPKLYTSVIWDTYRAKTWKESNSLSCTLGARCALEQLVECAPGKKRRRRTLCSVHREQLEQTLLTCNDTGHLTSTHPLPSRCTNISGAMYAGVPRGSVCTLPQPRPLARGMARSANPKSLILADMDTVPSGSSLVTHSTCERNAGREKDTITHALVAQPADNPSSQTQIGLAGLRSRSSILERMDTKQSSKCRLRTDKGSASRTLPGFRSAWM